MARPPRTAPRRRRRRPPRDRPPRSPRSPLAPTLILLLILLISPPSPSPAASGEIVPPPSSLSSYADPDEQDPNLRPMTFDIGYGPEVFNAYVTPDVSTFYGDVPGSRTPAVPKFKGLAGKFVNASPDPLHLYWDPIDGRSGVVSFIGKCAPFGSCGTATFPLHRFYFSPPRDPERRVHTFDVRKGRCVYYYDPFDVPGDEAATRRNLEGLSLEQYQAYERLMRSRRFEEKYREFAGRDYLSTYPRDRPIHYMWRADRFGQEHWVATRETHFVEMPPEEEMGEIREVGRDRILGDGEPRLLEKYRADGPLLNMTLTVLSCAPRVFEVRNFLGDVEVRHIVRLASGVDLRLSTTGDSGGPKASSDTKTRTSRNSWVGRERSPIIDAVYRRAADLLRIDEALLRRRGEGEDRPEVGSRGSMAERLQLVHYDVGQEYTAHHDFGYRAQVDPRQPDRFATLLLYLNEGMGGGETSFPRWMNAHTSDPLSVVPEVGKAVLFYSQLPDGNMNDLSQHAAVPVTRGEKWLINLWVRDPFYE